MDNPAHASRPMLCPLAAPVCLAHLGLAEGTLVAQGGADAFIGMIGLGVVAPGQMALLTGVSRGGETGHACLGLGLRRVGRCGLCMTATMECKLGNNQSVIVQWPAGPMVHPTAQRHQ
jgi:hypothetical protein